MARKSRKPTIAVFSGPNTTIQNSQPLVTSNKARSKHGLPLLRDASGQPLPQDLLFHQRLAAPARVYVEQFSAHPLESDAARLYAPPDGYLDAEGRFHRRRRHPSDRPVYEIELQPEDGLYPLPYMARQASGEPWEGVATHPGAPFGRARQTFYPDASRVFEEIERAGGGLSGLADYHFFRAAPAGGYTRGLAAECRTDQGSGDIPPERLGRDFFPYGAYAAVPPRARLATVTNMVQRVMDLKQHRGAIWLGGSPNIEDTIYWFNLLIDTTRPLTSTAAQRRRGTISADGDANIVSCVHYLVSRVWADARGRNALGAVLIQDQQVFAAREVQKADARPGGYLATGGHGGILGSLGEDGPRITFLPSRRHTWRSELRLSQLPRRISGVRRRSGRPRRVQIPVKTASGELLPSAIPLVTMVKDARWREDEGPVVISRQPDILARVKLNLESYPLSGMVAEGMAPYGKLVPSVEGALLRGVLSGIPVVKTARGNAGGFMQTDPENLFIEGQNLTTTKARILLMAAILKLGMLPPARDPERPTESERGALRRKIAEYQQIFFTH